MRIIGRIGAIIGRLIKDRYFPSKWDIEWSDETNAVKPDAPSVSVCIPVYNGEDFIAAAIESVLRQTWMDFELVVVDNHSTDRTLEIASRYRDNRMRVFANDRNLGPERNWNKALQLARGDFIKLLCHDDVLYPACLDKQVAVLTAPQNAGVALVCCKRDIIDLNGRRIMSRCYPGPAGRRLGRAAVRQIVRHGTNLIGEPAAALFRAEAIRKVGLFDARFPYVIDLEYWCRLLQEGDLYCMQEPLCAFRVLQKSWSLSLGRSQRCHFIQLAESLAFDPTYSVTALDLLAGRLASLVQATLRRLFYLVYRMPNRE